MDTGRISSRYAKAIYEYAFGKKDETNLYEKMKMLSSSFSSFHAIQKVMENPTLSLADKKKILITGGGEGKSKTYNAVLDLVLNNHRETYIFSIALMYQEYYRKEKGIVIGKLTTSIEIDKKTEIKLKELITQNADKEIDFDVHTDPSIIGGFILELESNQMDASVKGQLRKLRSTLIELNKDIG